LGAWQGRFGAALDENKLAIANIDHLPGINPQFREYLKARLLEYQDVLPW
jgi:hypothetical protein